MNVTPMIDVVMVLIVFFLIVGRLASDRAGVRLAESGLGRVDESTPAVTITIAPGPVPPGAAAPAQGAFAARVVVNGLPVADEAELERLLRDAAARWASEHPEAGAGEAGPAETGDGPQAGSVFARLPVQVAADKGLGFERIRPVLAVCARLGVIEVGLITERAP
ncbi:MAG: hypothetical protein C0475_07425 [Planctomyces sp.]|nr:hypothetical protein [Planctomyces sp.]MBA4120248.1 hypothetical protein [Isosphaera sp.]